MAINIEIVADTSKALGPVNKMADAYDEVSGTLKDLARSGDAAGNDLERALSEGDRAADKLADGLDDVRKEAKDLGKAGKSAGDDLERGLKDGEDAAKDLDRKADAAFDSISDNARKTGKDVGDSSKKGFREAEQASETFSNEARSNLSETVSSFRGDMEDVPQIFQDIMGGVVADLPVAGAAAAAAVAVAVGLAIAQMQKMAEENTALQEQVGETAGKMYDAGGAFKNDDILEQIREIAFALAEEDNAWTFWKDEAVSYVGLVKDAMEELGDADAGRDAFKALAGDVEAAARAQDKLAAASQEAKQAQQEHMDVTADGVVILDAEGRKIQEGLDARQRLSDKIEEQTGVTAEASEEVAYYTEIMGQSRDVTEEAADAVRDHADALNESAGNAMGLVDAENAYIETTAQMTKDIQANGQSMDAHTEAGRANRESLVDLASAANDYRDAAIAAGEGTDSVTAKVQESRDAFITAAEAAGLDSDAARALADSYGLVPANVETQVAAYGTEEAKAAVDGVAAPTEAPVEVTTNGTEAAAQGAVDSVTGGTAEVEVTTAGTDADTQARVDGIKGKEVKVDVDDMLTVRAVQDRINGIRGKDVYVNLRIGNEAQFLADIQRLTAPRTQYVNMTPRQGTAVAP